MRKYGFGMYVAVIGFVLLGVTFFNMLFFHAVQQGVKNDVYDRSPSLEAIKIDTPRVAPVTIHQEPHDSAIAPEMTTPSTVPIFMYHYIRDYSDGNDPIGVNLSVSPKRFEQQVSWLQSSGYQTVSVHFLKYPNPISLKPIILTFDDGYQDAYTNAFPILQKYHIMGVFYIIVNKVGTPGYLTWDEISSMQDAGMVFGSHTLTHPNLETLSIEQIHQELQESKDILSQKLGHLVTDFCYPSGKYNDAVVRELQSDQYETATTTYGGIATTKDDMLTLKRIRIMENTNIQFITSR